MTDMVVLILGAVTGGVVAWFWCASQSRAATASIVADLRATIGAHEGTIRELRNQVAERNTELVQLLGDLDAVRDARTVAHTKYEEALVAIEHQKQFLADADQKLKDTFTALSADALKTNNATFASQAEEKLTPLRECLARYEKQIREMENARQTAYGDVTAELRFIKKTHQQLHQQTTNLVTALRAPQVKGRWGEITLHRVVEVAWMSPHCDFIEQPTVDTDAGRLRPDLIVTLPGGDGGRR